MIISDNYFDMKVNTSHNITILVVQLQKYHSFV